MLNQNHQNPSTGITKQQIIAHAASQAQKLMQTQPIAPNMGMITLQTGNNWMQQAEGEPDALMLFGEFWHQGELCILFADTNLGKSILAVQIGDSISRGEPIYPLRLQAGEQQVIYLDFELTKKQFQHRYKNAENEQYQWSPLFLRGEIDPEKIFPDGKYTFEDYLNLSLEKAVEESGTRILIIDNLTYLRNETEKAKDALPLMKHLKNLKNQYGLSILALAHTPKRDGTRPITHNDLQGSKMLMNFCDSAFAIGKSQKDTSLRYLKQIKQRNTEEIYGSDRICLFNITKPGLFLKFDFVDYGREWEHLRDQSDEEREQLKTQITELLQQGKSVRETAAMLQISRSKVERISKAAKNG
ncbi:MAG TPA: AAA family ATPase [Mucilaginibacter sp.]|jgi:RecA-family ATPase|nr:AAA family ATPase [Mucilaginibacter sp.]